MEKLLYELRPYFYALLAIYSLSNYQISKLMFFSGLLLAFCSFVVFSMRNTYRSNLALQRVNSKK